MQKQPKPQNKTKPMKGTPPGSQTISKAPKISAKAKADVINWYAEAKVSCVCGSSFVTGSTLKEIKLDICNVCHPFYTGTQKLVDVEGRVERFQKRYAKFNKAQAHKMQSQSK